MDKHKKFVKDIIEMIANGYSLDGGDIEELLKENGLIRFEIYDIEKHAHLNIDDIAYLEPGVDQIWIYIGDEDVN